MTLKGLINSSINIKREVEKMNILHINSNYLTSKLHENLIDKTESEKIHNTVFMPIKKETVGAFLYESKYEVYSPVTFNDIDKYLFHYKQKKIFSKLEETLKPSEYDLVQAHTLFTDGHVAYKLFKQYNIPYIVTVRGSTDIDGFFKLRFNLRGIGKKILRNARKIIFLSETNRKDLLSNYIKKNEFKNHILEKSIVLPNGIDDFWFENEGNPKSLNYNEPLKIIFAGQIIERKNLLATVRALNLLKKEHNINSVYTIVGKRLDGKYADKVNNEAEVEYIEAGVQPREQLIKYYRSNDIFVMPSFSETFGLVYPEAMSQGLPVIYTRDQGFDGQFENGSVGYAVDADNPKNIAEQILKVIENYDEMSQKALQKYVKFNWGNLSKEYLNIYKEIVL